MINDKFPGKPITSCCVNEYDEDGFISEHSDNESTLGPESVIFALSIGATGTITFKSMQDGREIQHEAVHMSLYTMSRESQNYWTHRIDRGDIRGKRYLFTFRHVSSSFKKSLLVIGDSNANKLKFGEGKGKLGFWTPGKVEFAPTVDHINPISCNVKSYKNVLLHVGVNDLKAIDNLSGVNQISNKLITKCKEISTLNPSAKLYISPVLPTRDMNMNRKAICMNLRVYEYVKCCFNMVMLDCNSFLDQMGLLRTHFCSKPGDPIHLGSRGIGNWVSIIKEYVHNADGGLYKSARVDGRPYSGVSSVNSGRVNGMRRVNSGNMRNVANTGNEAFPVLSRQMQT